MDCVIDEIMMNELPKDSRGKAVRLDVESRNTLGTQTHRIQGHRIEINFACTGAWGIMLFLWRHASGGVLHVWHLTKWAWDVT